jgi:hypothetical protein
MLAVAPRGGKCRVMEKKKKTTAIFTSECWLQKVGVKMNLVGNKINALLSVASADPVKSI